jgi:hypothetical protein
MGPLGGVVAEDSRAYWLARQGRTGSEPGKIHGIEDDPDLLRRNSGIFFQTLPAAIVHCNMAQHPWEHERVVVPCRSIVAYKNRWSVAEVQQGDQGLGMMMPVNNIRNRLDLPYVAEYRDTLLAHLIGEGAKNRRIDRRLMAQLLQLQR